MKGGKRALSAWNVFVKNVYAEGKKKNSNYQFKNALRDASRRKSEMKSSSNIKNITKNKRGSKKHKMSMAAGTRRRRH